jgi:transposase-like protein
MKIPTEQIQYALSMYFKGMPLSSIRKQLKEQFDYYPSDSTIYRWIHQSTEKVMEATKDHNPQVGNTWIAYESAIPTRLKKYLIFDIIDTDTHFLLASRLSTNRKIEDIRFLIESAMQKAHKMPEVILTRAPSKYLKAVEEVLGLDFKRVDIKRPNKGYYTKFSVYWRRIMKGRGSMIRRLKSLSAVQLTFKGWMADYNYYSPQKALLDRTPADVAKVGYRYKVDH